MVIRHVWAEYLEQAEDNRYTYGIREWYALRKETTERDFAQAKELMGLRYTQMYGAVRMEMKAAFVYSLSPAGWQGLVSGLSAFIPELCWL